MPLGRLGAQAKRLVGDMLARADLTLDLLVMLHKPPIARQVPITEQAPELLSLHVIQAPKY